MTTATTKISTLFGLADTTEDPGLAWALREHAQRLRDDEYRRGAVDHLRHHAAGVDDAELAATLHELADGLAAGPVLP